METNNSYNILKNLDFRIVDSCLKLDLRCSLDEINVHHSGYLRPYGIYLFRLKFTSFNEVLNMTIG